MSQSTLPSANVTANTTAKTAEYAMRRWWQAGAGSRSCRSDVFRRPRTSSTHRASTTDMRRKTNGVLRYAAFDAVIAAPVDPPACAHGYNVWRPKKTDSISAAATGRPDIMASAIRRSTTDQPAPDRYCIEMKSAPESATESRY